VVIGQKSFLLSRTEEDDEVDEVDSFMVSNGVCIRKLTVNEFLLNCRNPRGNEK